MQSAKDRIRDLVALYKITYLDEYKDTCEVVKYRRENAINDYGDMTKTNDYIIRTLVEIPETLFTIFKKNLTEDQWEYYDSLGGKKWFAKAYPEFSLNKKQ